MCPIPCVNIAPLNCLMLVCRLTVCMNIDTRWLPVFNLTMQPCRSTYSHSLFHLFTSGQSHFTIDPPTTPSFTFRVKPAEPCTACVVPAALTSFDKDSIMHPFASEEPRAKPHAGLPGRGSIHRDQSEWQIGYM